MIVTNADSEVVRIDKKKKALYGIFFDLGSDPEENIRIIVRRSCEILEGACSLYNRIDYENDKIVTWAGHNLPPDYEFSDSPEGHICFEAVVKGEEDIVAIPNLDGTIYEKSDVNVGRYKLKSYLGSSVSIEEEKTGSLCIVDTVVRNFSEEEKEIIHTLAKALSLEEMRKNAERKLRNSINEQDYLMKEIHHRVKNNLLMITSLIRLKENSAEKENFSDLIHQIDAIRIVHEKLYEAGDLRKIEIKSYFTELIETIFSSFSAKSVNLSIEIDNFFINSRQILTAGLLINEITTNALKHGFRDCDKPEYSLSVKKKEDVCEIVIRNNGSKIPERVSLDYPETLGMRLISALTEQLGGTVNMIKSPSPEFIIRFKPDVS